MKYTKYERRQPDHLKRVPFVDPAPLMQPWEKKMWAVLVGFWLTFLWLNPFGWPW